MNGKDEFPSSGFWWEGKRSRMIDIDAAAQDQFFHKYPIREGNQTTGRSDHQFSGKFFFSLFFIKKKKKTPRVILAYPHQLTGVPTDSPVSGIGLQVAAVNQNLHLSAHPG